jgi:NAD(P)H-dependent FMN reductase
MKIVAFGASTSKNSINKSFATYVASLFDRQEIEILDLNDFPLPLFNVDIEAESGIPDIAKQFNAKLRSADLIIISLAEHNGSYTSAFKNLFDWASRHESKMFAGKKMILLSTSPGARGGLGVMGAALVRFPIHGAEIVGHFSLPKFYENFEPQSGITNSDLKNSFDNIIQEVKSILK